MPLALVLLALAVAVAAAQEMAFTVAVPEPDVASTIVLAFAGKVQRAVDGAHELRAADFQLAHANGGGAVAILDVSTSGDAVTIAELHVDPGRWLSSADGLLIDVAQAALVGVATGRVVQQQPTIIKYDGSTFPVTAPTDAAADTQTVAGRQVVQTSSEPRSSDDALLYAGLAGLLVLIGLSTTAIALFWRRTRSDGKVVPSSQAASPARPAFVGELDSSTPASMSISTYSGASSALSNTSSTRPGRLAPLPSVADRSPPTFALEQQRAAPLAPIHAAAPAAQPQTPVKDAGPVQTPRSTIKRRLPISESPFVPKHARPSPRPAMLDSRQHASDSLECSPLPQPQALSAPSPVVPTHSDRRFAHLTGDAAPTVQVLIDFSCTDVVGTAVAAGDYDAQDEDEASFRDGYTITVHRVDPSGWWDATIDATGERGLVPGNFFRPDADNGEGDEAEA